MTLNTAWKGSTTFTAASSDLANFVILNEANGGVRTLKESTCALFSSITGSGTNAPTGTFTLTVALTDGTTVFTRRDISCTITTGRAGYGGSTGAYLVTLIDPQTGRHITDLIGMHRASGGSPAALFWMIGCTSVSGITNLGTITVYWQCEPSL